jgi:hypothetical protein
MSYRFAHGLALLASLALAAPGCGGPPGTRPAEENARADLALDEVGSFLQMQHKGGKPAPKSIKDLAPMENGFPQAYTALKSGELVAYWGVDFDPSDSTTVVAYEKAVPEAGGRVLMRDGSLKSMTADEFKAATKPADGKLSTEVDAKADKKAK